MKKLLTLAILTTLFAFETQASCPADPNLRANVFYNGAVYLMKAEVHSKAMNPALDVPHYQNFLKMRDCAVYNEQTGRAILSEEDQQVLREKIEAYLTGSNPFSKPGNVVVIKFDDYQHLKDKFGTEANMVETLVRYGSDPQEAWLMFQHGIFYPESLE